MSKVTLCPICKKTAGINPLNTYRPFCSKRCRLIDLGQWINETYSISDTTRNIDNIDFEPIEDIKH